MMNSKETNQRVLDAQREHWQRTFAGSPEMFGREPSKAAGKAAELFGKEGKRKVLELGSGQGRDTLFFLRKGFEVWAADYSGLGLEAIRRKAEGAGLGGGLKTVEHDVRQPLPFAADTFEEGELPRRLWLVIQRKEHEDGNSDGKFGGVQAGQERP